MPRSSVSNRALSGSPRARARSTSKSAPTRRKSIAAAPEPQPLHIRTPHQLKNKFIKSHYAVHHHHSHAMRQLHPLRLVKGVAALVARQPASPAAAAGIGTVATPAAGLSTMVHSPIVLEEHALYNNETLNIFTALIMAVIAVVTAASALSASASASAATGAASSSSSSTATGEYPLTQLLILSAAMFFNSVCVTFYHTFATVPSLYHIASATDLVGIALLALGPVAGNTLPRMADWSWLRLIHSAVIGGGSSAYASGDDIATYAQKVEWALSVGVIIAVVAAVVCAVRLRIGRESPPAFLVLNSIFFFLLVPDWAFTQLAAPSDISATAYPITVLVLLLGGGAILLLKVPERFVGTIAVSPPAPVAVNATTAASAAIAATKATARDSRSTHSSSVQLVLANPLFDTVLNGHALWHLCYTSAFALYSRDALAKAAMAAAQR
jgi:hypothetical protein